MFLYSKDKSSTIQNEQDIINYESKFKNILCAIIRMKIKYIICIIYKNFEYIEV